MVNRSFTAYLRYKVRVKFLYKLNSKSPTIHKREKIEAKNKSKISIRMSVNFAKLRIARILVAITIKLSVTIATYLSDRSKIDVESLTTCLC